jgi:hypothetical protein
MELGSSVFGLEKYAVVTAGCRGDSRNHGPRRVDCSKVAGLADV